MGVNNNVSGLKMLRMRLVIGVSVGALVLTLAVPGAAFARRGDDRERGDDSYHRSSSRMDDDRRGRSGKNMRHTATNSCRVDDDHSSKGRRGRSSDDSIHSSSAHQNRERTRTRSSAHMGSMRRSDDSRKTVAANSMRHSDDRKKNVAVQTNRHTTRVDCSSGGGRDDSRSGRYNSGRHHDDDSYSDRYHDADSHSGRHSGDGSRSGRR